MKRIYLLLLLMVVGATGAFAQRQVDLKVELVKPNTSTVLHANGTFDIDAVVTNLGPDSLKSLDSTLYAFTIQGGFISINQVVYRLRYLQPLQVNDTFHIKFTGLKPNYTAVADSQREFCALIMPRGLSTAGAIVDNDQSNNTACVKFLWEHTSIEDINKANGKVNSAAVYPNPAKANFNIEVNLEYSTDVTVKVMDLTGRMIMHQEKTQVGTGKHAIPFSTETLSNGLYIYQVEMGSHTATGKFSVSK